jgi:hypothetical protein
MEELAGRSRPKYRPLTEKWTVLGSTQRTSTISPTETARLGVHPGDLLPHRERHHQKATHAFRHS